MRGVTRPQRRPALPQNGFKWTLAPWSIGPFPEYRRYVEPFGGRAGPFKRASVAHGM